MEIERSPTLGALRDQLRWAFRHRLKPGFVYRFSQRCLALHFINASYESGDRTLFIWKLSDRQGVGVSPSPETGLCLSHFSKMFSVTFD
ncbi:MAG TPA: hypothetical protein VK184_04005 [Nostocaceae cyanobacterium]|nr:hypothetical protein [Nostocaceae cyanobacterium]